MKTIAKADFDLHISSKIFATGENEIQQNTSLYWILYLLEWEVNVNALQKSTALLTPVFPSTRY